MRGLGKTMQHEIKECNEHVQRVAAMRGLGKTMQQH